MSAMLRAGKPVRPAANFTEDEAPANNKHTAELFAMVRDNGRILDEVRCVLGGNETLEAEFSLGNLFDLICLRGKS